MKQLKPTPIWEQAKERILLFIIIFTGMVFLLGHIQTVKRPSTPPFIKEGNKEDSLVHVSFTIRDAASFSKDTIAIKVSNHSEKVIELKKVVVQVKRRWFFTPSRVNVLDMDPPPAYDLTIDLSQRPPYQMETTVSGQVNPYKSEWFYLSLGHNRKGGSLPWSGTFIYLADLTLVYNEKGLSVIQPDIFFAFLNLRGNAYESDKETRKHINEITKLQGTKSEGVKKMLNYWKRKK